MLFKIYALVFMLNLMFSAQMIKTQDDFKSPSQFSETEHLSRDAIENMANLTNESNLWILLPSNISDSQLSDEDFSLFKLNTDLISGRQERDLARGPDNRTSSDLTALDSDENRSESLTRQGRKMNLFKNVLNKPKVSPLYLVNGTVCRFVNSQPICTTLSTTGLFRGPNQFLTPQMQNNGVLNGFLQQPQGNSNLQPNQRLVSPNQQPSFNNQQPSFNNQQPNFNNQQPNFNNQQPNFNNQQPNFNNQQGNFQPFRPSAVLDDEIQDLKVEASNSSSKASSLVKSQQQADRPQAQINVAQSARPTNYLVGRRPLNFLSFARPFRSQYQRRGKHDSSNALADEFKAEN